MNSRLTVVGGNPALTPFAQGYEAGRADGYQDALDAMADAKRGFGIGLFIALVFGVAIGFTAGIIWMGSA